MDSTKELLRKGIRRPHRAPSFLFDTLKWKTGIEAWGKRAPSVKVAEYRHKYTSYPHETTSIWEKEWDLLVILDACRPEWMRTVQDEYNFITDVDAIHSVGSHSDEWISNTFTDEYADEMADTVYITGNHYADGLADSDLKAFETAHDYGEWAYDSASPPANVITDLAVQTAREEDWGRCIVHYMQPHKPFLTREGERGEFSVKDWSLGYQPYHRHFDGELSLDDLHAEFTENLRYVLDELEILLENIDAPSTVLTSDHGQALGEAGLWDHTVGVKHPCMRRVPWVKTTATDEHLLDPKEYSITDYDEETVMENLEMLGYH